MADVTEADDRLEDGEADGRYEGFATRAGAGRGNQAPAAVRPARSCSCRRRVQLALARRGRSLGSCRSEVAVYRLELTRRPGRLPELAFDVEP